MSWELECADQSRVGEFLDCYERREEWSEDDRFALMALIVSSYDDALAAKETENDWETRIRGHLQADFALHEWTIYYWCAWDPEAEEDPERGFSVTPLMREIWQKSG